MRRLVVVSLVLFGLATPLAGAESRLPRLDGLGACTSSDPPYPFHGSCGTFNGHNTYYGSYGTGFPSDMGWGFCAFEAAHGGWYPAPGYNYVASSAPEGADTTDFAALGWALSEADRLGWWTSGKSGQFDADDVAVAGKLLYDSVAWGTALPSLSGSLKSAMTALRALFLLGVTRAPTLAISLDGGGSTLFDEGVVNVSLRVTSTGVVLAGQSVRVSLPGASFTNGSSSITVTTDSDGRAQASFHINDSLAGAYVATARATLARTGMVFFSPTMFPDDAQILAAARDAAVTTSTVSLTALGPPTGTIQIHKTVDDPAYFPATGAVFELFDSSMTSVATLTIDDTGYSNVSGDLSPGAYTLRESEPPPHYAAMDDRLVTVVAGANTVVAIGPNEGDVITRASLRFEKYAAGTEVPLAGAEFRITFDGSHSGVADGTVYTCDTNASGECAITDLLPGDYWLEEITAPVNYVVSVTPQWITLAPGDSTMMRFWDDPAMTSLAVHKYSAELSSMNIPRATYDLYVVNPGPPTTPPDRPSDAPDFPGVTFMARGVTDRDGQLHFDVPVGYRWCYHEVSAPAGYVIDPSLHCATGVAVSHATVPRPEHSSPITFAMYKFDRGDPTAGVPGAYYALFVRLPFPHGYQPPPTPTNIDVPARYALWAVGVTTSRGALSFSVPGGHWWCVRELYAPPNYLLDPSLHCTAEPLVRSSPTSVTHVAIAETLAATGITLAWPLVGWALVLAGWALRRRAEKW